MRLANYFDARADALVLALNADDRLQLEAVSALSSALAPESIEFHIGKLPADVTAELMKLAIAGGRSA